MANNVDVVIVGAGLSGIAAAYRLDEQTNKSYVILEAKDRLGGTWDTFRYPGVRSDSDMYTLSYPFAPWQSQQAIATGAEILTYLQKVAADKNVTGKIKYKHAVTRANWSNESNTWTVSTANGATFTCSALVMASGYYEHAEGYTPDFSGIADFEGRVEHSQLWPEDLDWKDKKVVVIGSGATAVAMVPAMAQEAEHVTMLQRSPTFIVPESAVRSPWRITSALLGMSSLLTTLYFYVLRLALILKAIFYWVLAKSCPQYMKTELTKAAAELVPEYAADFVPRYNPWDQRICLDADTALFETLQTDSASVVTATIDRFVSNGIRLSNGKLLEADIVVMATGLQLKLFGGVELGVDGKKIVVKDQLVYRGYMLSELPNFFFLMGYVNQSWTTRIDATLYRICRLLNTLEKKGLQVCTPSSANTARGDVLFGLTSSYVSRGLATWPVQGTTKPWVCFANPVEDWFSYYTQRVLSPSLDVR